MTIKEWLQIKNSALMSTNAVKQWNLRNWRKGKKCSWNWLYYHEIKWFQDIENINIINVDNVGDAEIVSIYFPLVKK